MRRAFFISNQALRRPAVGRHAVLLFAAAAAMLLASACGRAPAPPVQQVEAAPVVDEASRQTDAARHLSPAEVADLESRAAKDPGDLESHAKLLVFYSAWNHPEQTRRLMLWMIRTHPEGFTVWQSRQFAPMIDPTFDPEGYQQGKRLWLPHLVQHHLPLAELSNAASYFKVVDPVISQKLLMRLEVKDEDDNNDLGDPYYRLLADGPAWKWAKPLTGRQPAKVSK